MGDCPEDVTVPVILLPGIMGSRLRQSGGDMAWDPDSTVFMARRYLWNAGTGSRPWGGAVNDARVAEAAAARKDLLVGPSFDEGYLQPAEYDPLSGLTSDQILHNWGSVVQMAYLPTLQHISQGSFRLQLETAIRQRNPSFSLVRMPVYACGYNWSASNEASGRYAARKISRWVEAERQWASENGAQCPGAILVTHSMGGFVARAACLQGGAAGDVFAVLSTVMPTDGAAAAYKRFHFGFERPGALGAMATYLVLGRDGALVTALLGHMPGAQELLPNKRYRDNAGNTKWLAILNPERNAVGRFISGDAPHLELPNSNPYTEIYRQRDRMYRAANPEWLFPEARGAANPRVDPFDAFVVQNRVAEGWHDAITTSGDFHEVTYICHSTDAGHPTYDRVDWTPDLTGGSLGRSVRDSDLDTSEGSPDYDRENIIWGEEADKRVDGPFLRPDFRIAPAAGAGDMTVPASSNLFASLPQSRKTPHARGYEHEAAIKDRLVLNWIKDKMVEVLAECDLY